MSAVQSMFGSSPWGDAPEPPKLEVEDLDRLLTWAADLGASDILLATDEQVMVRLRREYHRVSKRRLNTPELAGILDRIHVANSSAMLLGADPANYSYTVRRSRSESLRFRANATAAQTALSSSGIALIFRALSAEPPTLAELGIEDEIVEAHRELAESQGLCFVVGATGTGKTTLLAAMMRDVIERRPKLVLTYEAPIEYLLSRPGAPGLALQTEVPRHVGSFSEGVTNALRRAPDIIMVGESLDRQTILGAIQAGQTGHAVYATLHAHSVATALPRAIGDFPDGEQQSVMVRALDVIRLIVTQRLVGGIDGKLVALREFLRIDRAMRRELLKTPLTQLQSSLHELVDHHGVSLIKDARAKQHLLAPGVMDSLEAEFSERSASAQKVAA